MNSNLRQKKKIMKMMMMIKIIIVKMTKIIKVNYFI